MQVNTCFIKLIKHSIWTFRLAHRANVIIMAVSKFWPFDSRCLLVKALDLFTQFLAEDSIIWPFQMYTAPLWTQLKLWSYLAETTTCVTCGCVFGLYKARPDWYRQAIPAYHCLLSFPSWLAGAPAATVLLLLALIQVWHGRISFFIGNYNNPISILSHTWQYFLSRLDFLSSLAPLLSQGLWAFLSKLHRSKYFDHIDVEWKWMWSRCSSWRTFLKGKCQLEVVKNLQLLCSTITWGRMQADWSAKKQESDLRCQKLQIFFYYVCVLSFWLCILQDQLTEDGMSLVIASV